MVAAAAADVSPDRREVKHTLTTVGSHPISLAQTIASTGDIKQIYGVVMVKVNTLYRRFESATAAITWCSTAAVVPSDLFIALEVNIDLGLAPPPYIIRMERVAQGAEHGLKYCTGKLVRC